MAGFERVLSGRPSRHPEPWATGGAVARPGSAASQPERPRDPLDDPAVQARIAEVLRVAEEHGLAAGRQQGEGELAASIAAAQALAHKLETAVPKDVDMLARTVAELAVLIARRIVGAELRHDPTVLVAAIEAGLRQAAGASIITVELHPQVVAAVEGVWMARHGSRHRGFTWSFTGDPTLPPDGCRLRTEHGIVEAGFEDQLAEVAAALDAAIPGYLGAVLGPTGDADAQAAEREALTGRRGRPGPDPEHPIHVPSAPPAASRAAGSPAGSPTALDPAAFDETVLDEAALEAALADSNEPGASGSDAGPRLFGAGLVGGIPDDLDLDALANLGLDDLAAFGDGEGPA